MKTIFNVVMLLLLNATTSFAQADAIDKYFSQYVDDERFTVVYISSKMFSLISDLDIDSEDEETQMAMEMIQDLRGLRILTVDTLSSQFYDEAIQKIDTREYEMLMKVRDGKENVQFFIKDSDGAIINELLLLVGGGDDFVLLSFMGNIDLDKVSALANKIDVKGAEHLDKIKENEE